MGRKDLQERYGGNSRAAIQRAIRAECPGGNALLDLVELVAQIRTRESVPAVIVTQLNVIRDQMADYVIAASDPAPSAANLSTHEKARRG